MQKKRQRVVEEIISTEEKYCSHLTKLVEVAIPKFIEKAEKDLCCLTREKVQDIFANVETLLTFHTTFLKELKSNPIAGTFLKYSDYLKLYTAFVVSFEASNDTIVDLSKNSSFARFMTEMTDILGSDLPSLLIMPVQRIPRYKLLLEQLLRFTPKDDAEVQTLVNACSKVDKIASFVNEAKKKLEGMNKLFSIKNQMTAPFQLISPHRVFIRDDILTVTTASFFFSDQAYKFLLFNDIVLWTTQNGKYKGVRFLRGLSIKIADNDIGCILVQEGEENVSIKCSSKNHRKNWISAVGKARDELVGERSHRLTSLDQREQDMYLDPDREGERDQLEYRENSLSVGHVPMDPRSLRGLVNSALKQQTIGHVKKSMDELKSQESLGIFSPLASLRRSLKKVRGVMEDEKHQEAADEEEEQAIENTNLCAVWIAHKASVSVQKFGAFSYHAKSDLAPRKESLLRKFQVDDKILEEAVQRVAFARQKSADRDTQDASWNQFWTEHFGEAKLASFEDIKSKYSKEFSIKLSDNMAIELLKKFGYPEGTTYSSAKEYPISKRDFKFAAQTHGFPFSSDNKYVEFPTSAEKLPHFVSDASIEDLREFLSSQDNLEMLSHVFDNGDTIYHIAAKRGEPDIMKLIKSKTNPLFLPDAPSPNTTNKHNLLPLHYAAFNLHDEVYDILLRITSQDALAEYPILHDAVRYSHIKSVENLLKRKADIDATDPSGDTPLTIASATSNADMVKLLLEFNAQPTTQAVEGAIDGDSSEAMSMVLENTTQAQKRTILYPEDRPPVLHQAASLATSKVCEVLLENGSSTRDKNSKTLETPFLEATKSGNIPTVKYFRSHDASVIHDKDKDGKTALHLSCEQTDVTMTKSLLGIGVDVNAQDNLGDTALTATLKLDKEPSDELVKVITESKGIDLDIKNYKNESPLLIAAMRGHSNSAKRLIENGAKISELGYKNKMLKRVLSRLSSHSHPAAWREHTSQAAWESSSLQHPASLKAQTHPASWGTLISILQWRGSYKAHPAALSDLDASYFIDESKFDTTEICELDFHPWCTPRGTRYLFRATSPTSFMVCYPDEMYLKLGEAIITSGRLRLTSEKGVVYTAAIVGRQLRWDDGDVWEQEH